MIPTHENRVTTEMIRGIRDRICKRLCIADTALASCVSIRSYYEPHISCQIVESVVDVFSREINEDTITEDRIIELVYRKPRSAWNTILDLCARIPHLPSSVECWLRKKVKWDDIREIRIVPVRITRKSYRMIPIGPGERQWDEKRYAIWLNGG